MTDNEIIKALERCPQHTECCYCNSLEECGNKRILTTSVFDLINRQKAEIEALVAGQETLQKHITYLNAEIERLKAEIKKKQKTLDEVLELAEMGLACIDEHDRIIKPEAIKEFAERLKENYCFTDRWGKIIPISTVDNLVKEMTEVETIQRKEYENGKETM